MATKVSTSENKVLFGVINWGIGHATRSSVVIDELLSRGFNVEILSNGKALNFLKNRYKNRCVYHEGYGFEVPYENNSWVNYLRLLRGLWKSYRHDTRFIRILMQNTNYDAVINDCRPFNNKGYGGKKILINHQLTPNWPCLKAVFQHGLDVWQKQHDMVWVPDMDGGKLSGGLSQNSRVNNKLFIGLLSRLNPKIVSKKEGVGVLFYGFQVHEIEENIIMALKQKGLDTLFADKRHDDCENMLMQCEMVISKPGYSSVMELYGVNKPVLLVNVAWHAEQSMLFRHLISKNIFYGTERLSVQDILALRAKMPLASRATSDGKSLKLAVDCINNDSI